MKFILLFICLLSSTTSWSHFLNLKSLNIGQTDYGNFKSVRKNCVTGYCQLSFIFKSKNNSSLKKFIIKDLSQILFTINSISNKNSYALKINNNSSRTISF